MFQDSYRDRKVLVTGHTGFKGSYLVYWLKQLGAEACGVGLAMDGDFDHFNLIKPDIRSEIFDIRDRKKLDALFAEFQPEAVFHLAAQPLVRLSYLDPVETFDINVTGTACVLDACRKCASCRAIVAITSDKCYENRETLTPYVEGDPMGGYDPYSASKGCAELVISSYRRSFFNVSEYGKKHNTLLASARAGNVVGGGDWARDRLIPDLMKGAAKKECAVIRNPRAVRPWQHVLEPLSGYLDLGAELLNGGTSFASAYNFGPDNASAVTVGEAAELLKAGWNEMSYEITPPADAPHEAGLLLLDASKAKRELGWSGVWDVRETLERTARWYRDFYCKNKINTAGDLADYISCAVSKGLKWTK